MSGESKRFLSERRRRPVVSRLVAAGLWASLLAAGCGAGAPPAASESVSSPSAATPAPTRSPAPASAASTASPSPTIAGPTASPEPAAGLDPCSLLTATEVAEALDFEAPTPTSYDTSFPGVFNDGRFSTCEWIVPYPTVDENRILTVRVCPCEVTTAQFAGWADTEIAETGAKAIPESGIGEQAFRFGFAIGIIFLHDGTAVELYAQGVPGLTGLPEATLDKNGAPYYRYLAELVIGRLP